MSSKKTEETDWVGLLGLSQIEIEGEFYFRVKDLAAVIKSAPSVFGNDKGGWVPESFKNEDAFEFEGKVLVKKEIDHSEYGLLGDLADHLILIDVHLDEEKTRANQRLLNRISLHLDKEKKKS